VGSRWDVGLLFDDGVFGEITDYAAKYGRKGCTLPA
jgi:hypothetical protein